MALINCPECSNKISDKAPACPHCGVVFESDEPTVEIQKSVINYVDADGKIKRGFVGREKIKESLPDPDSGEFYGLEYFKNGKRVIEIVGKAAFLMVEVT